MIYCAECGSRELTASATVHLNTGAMDFDGEGAWCCGCDSEKVETTEDRREAAAARLAFRKQGGLADVLAGLGRRV